MKREDVLKVFADATPEQLKALLDINGADVEKAKGKLADIQAELEVAQNTISNMTTEISVLKDSNASAEDYKKKFEELQADLERREEEAKLQSADKELTDKILSVFPKDKDFTSDYVRNGIIADMKARFAEDSTKGLQGIFDELTKDKEGIFLSQNPPLQMGGMGSVSSSEIDDKAIRAIMGIK